MEVNAQTRRFLNEQIRPLAEKARGVYAAGLAIQAIIGTHLSELLAAGAITVDPQTGVLSTVQPDTVLDDGRAAEGVTQITAGDLVAILNTLSGVVATIAGEPGIQAAMERASVRKLTQSE